MAKYLSEKDRRAIYLHLCLGYSQVKAYAETHPNQTKYSQDKNSSTYFKRVMATFDTLPFMARLEICHLGKDRVLTELTKRLESETHIFHEGIEVSKVPDNKVRMQATELLTKITGVDHPTDTETTGQDNSNQFEIVDYNAEETTQDIEDEKQ